MDRTTQRQNKRGLDSIVCQEEFTLIGSSLPPGRTGAACATAPASPAALPFITPEACPPAAAPPVLSPTALGIGNVVQTAYCPTAPGYSVTGSTTVTINANDQVQLIYFQTIDNITNNQLNYLYEAVPASSTAMISAALAGNTASVKQLTKLTDEQVDIFIPLVQDTQFIVDTLAVEKARNTLICQAISDAQYTACPTGSYTGGGVPSDIPYSPTGYSPTGAVLVNITLKSTTGSQTAFTAINIAGLTGAKEIADTIALAEAQRQLFCVYTNTEQQASCCTGPSGYINNLGYTNCVPNDILPVLPNLPPRVGSTGIAAETIFSTVSTEEADSVALTIALNNLNCYFPNEDSATACAGTGLASPYPTQLITDNLTWSSTASTITINEAIDIVDIPLNTRLMFTDVLAPGGLTAGTLYYITSATGNGSYATIKVSGATASHSDYENGTISFLSLSNTGSGATAAIMLSNSPGQYAYILRGEIIQVDTDASTATATAEAEEIVSSYLDCFWTNITATAICPTSSFTAIDGNAYNIGASLTASPSYSATIDAGSIISYVDQADANASASAAAYAGLQCSYCNAKIDPTCAPYSPTGGWTDAMLPLSDDLFTPNCWSVNATAGLPSETICDFFAAAAQNTALSVAGIPISTRVSNEVTCCYESIPVYNNIFCTTGAERSLTGYLSQDNFYLPSGTIIVCSTGPSASTNYPGSSGYFCGVTGGDTGAYFNSKQIEANDIAQDLANSFVKCYYTNDYQIYTTCPTSAPNLLAAGISTTGSFISLVSKADANAVAYEIAKASVVCVADDALGISCAEVLSSHTSDPVDILGLSLATTVDILSCSETEVTLSISGTPNMTSATPAQAKMVEITICSSTGASRTVLIPDFQDSAQIGMTPGGTPLFMILDSGADNATIDVVTPT